MKKHYLLIFFTLLFFSEAKSNIYYVTNNQTTGFGSLAAAIDSSNLHSGRDSIYFDIAGSTLAERTINIPVDSLLPNVEDEILIDGTTQPNGGYFGITAAKIRITSDNYSNTGIAFNADNCEVYGLWISRFETGVKFIECSNFGFGKVNNGNVITDCTSILVKITTCDEGSVVATFIGIDTSGKVGTSPLATGILVEEGSKKITLGGKQANSRNIVSGNFLGIRINDSKYITIQDSYIGTDFNGTDPVPNSTGIQVNEECDNITIGGDSVKYMNVISGNLDRGIDFEGLSSFIQGNMIGTDPTGKIPLGNGNYGVYFRDLANDDLVGGTLPGEGNVIAYNGAEGVFFESLLVKNIYIRGNSMYCNSQIVGEGGINVNGGNQSLQPPTIVIVTEDFISGTTYPTAVVDLYTSDSCDKCEGNFYVTTIAADGSGVFSYTIPINGRITVTANDPYGNTSEFSACADTSNTSCIFSDFFTSDTKVCTNDDLGFLDQTITAPGTTVNSWSWDFGDGQTSLDPNPIISYSTGGIYTVQLIVGNDDGCIDTSFTTIEVAEGVTANFSADTNVCFGTPVHFIDLSTTLGDTYILSWEWDLGDSSTSTFTDFTHLYDSVGNYTVKLTVVNNNECVDTHNESIKVRDYPSANFFASPDACIVDPVVFTDASNPAFGSTLAAWEWDFGDGGTSTDQNPQHLYTASGQYEVDLKVIDNFGCTDTTTKTVSILAGAIANFGWTISGLTVNFDNTSTVNADFAVQWLFGDGSTSSLLHPSHTYNSYGLYEVCLIVNDYTCEMSDTLCQEVLITGIENIVTNQLDLFPNPASTFVIIKNLPAEEFKVSIFNPLGELMHTVMSSRLSEDQTSIALPDLPDGIYWLHLQSEEQVFSGKIVIAR